MKRIRREGNDGMRDFWQCRRILALVCLAFCMTHHQAQGLNIRPSPSRTSPKVNNNRKTSRLDFAPVSAVPSEQKQQRPWRYSAIHSSLFRRQNLRPPQGRRKSSSTARNMVLTTPEAIIEQASTQKLLDDLLDESVRTSSRKPIMMQFDPSSSFVSSALTMLLLFSWLLCSKVYCWS